MLGCLGCRGGGADERRCRGGGTALARPASAPTPPATATTPPQVDAWLDFAAYHLKPGPGLAAAVRSLNAALALRTYLVGRSLTLADTVCWGCLQGERRWN